MIPILYANQSHSTRIWEQGEVCYLTFRSLECPELVHAFSTRMGGVSKGYFASMNLSFQRGDEPEAVMEIFKSGSYHEDS